MTVQGIIFMESPFESAHPTCSCQVLLTAMQTSGGEEQINS